MPRPRRPKPPEVSHAPRGDLADLTIAELIRKLELTWQPDGDTFLLPRSIGKGSLKPDAVDAEALQLQVRSGSNTVTFTASTASTVTTFPHGMAVAPRSVQITGIGNDLTWWVSGVIASTISVRANYSTALTGTFGFYWLAVY